MPSHPTTPLADIEADAHSESAMPRTRRDLAGTRRRILAAAIEEFAHDGSTGARVDAITRRTRTNERMLYCYYGSREKLFLTMLEHIYFRFKEVEEQAQIESSDSREAVTQFTRFVWDFYHESPKFIRLLNSENLYETRCLKTSPRLDELVSPIIEVLRGMVERGRCADISRGNIDVLRLYLMISTLGYYVLSNRYAISAVVGRDIAFTDEHEAFTQLHIKMLLAYLDRPKG